MCFEQRRPGQFPRQTAGAPSSVVLSELLEQPTAKCRAVLSGTACLVSAVFPKVFGDDLSDYAHKAHRRKFDFLECGDFSRTAKLYQQFVTVDHLDDQIVDCPTRNAGDGTVREVRAWPWQ
jgi:hypothetical protein